MLPALTSDQITALAPDSASIGAARSLAVGRAWLTLGRSERAMWGECKGSAREPYRTQIDLSEPAFRCSCPSRKFPCKHGLGLLLLVAGNPEAAAVAEPPPWVAEWLSGRARSAERRQERQPPAEQAAPTSPRSAASRSAASREARVVAGLAELERWLQDRLKAGLAALQAEAPAAFDTFAARMVDAQAPGVARLLRAAGESAASGPGWQSRLLDRLSRLHLLARAYANLADLPPATQADVRAAVGFTQAQDELLAAPGLRDRWLVLGRRVIDEERLRAQRTWLWGATSARAALILDFSAGGQPLDRSLVPGSTIDAELVFFPGAAPLRALLGARHALVAGVPPLPERTLTAASAGYAEALAANPWAERAPLLAGPLTLARAEERWHVRDAAGQRLPLPASFDQAWQLLAITAGLPFRLAGEWDGETLVPLCAQQGERLIGLSEQ
jgi:hypothetical protein